MSARLSLRNAPQLLPPDQLDPAGGLGRRAAGDQSVALGTPPVFASAYPGGVGVSRQPPGHQHEVADPGTQHQHHRQAVIDRLRPTVPGHGPAVGVPQPVTGGRTPGRFRVSSASFIERRCALAGSHILAPSAAVRFPAVCGELGRRSDLLASGRRTAGLLSGSE